MEKIRKRARLSEPLIGRIKDLYLKGESVKEIAQALGVSISTIYNALRRANISASRRGRLSQHEEFLLELNGFIKLKKKRRVSYNGAEIITIRLGVGMVGRKYSSYSFFGVKPFKLVFLVKDLQSFRFHLARMLLGMFYEKNPNPPRDLRKSFTHFLHSYNLEVEKEALRIGQPNAL